MKHTKKIMSWNVNGLRAIERKGNFDEIFTYGCDLYFFQEIKCREDQLSEKHTHVPDYFSYFHSHKEFSGRSGTALYTKEKPIEVYCGFTGNKDKHLDVEGRLITAIFPWGVAIGGYYPNGGDEKQRLPYKLEFYEAFLRHIEKLHKKHEMVIFCGDINTAHTEIDLTHPKANQNHTGFLPEERAWISKVIAKGYIDIFRTLHPNKTECYTWWDMKTRARDRNVGWRLDYFFISKESLSRVISVTHETQQFGSDHCPVILTINIGSSPSKAGNNNFE